MALDTVERMCITQSKIWKRYKVFLKVRNTHSHKHLKLLCALYTNYSAYKSVDASFSCRPFCQIESITL
jgi:hypothetical protein